MFLLRNKKNINNFLEKKKSALSETMRTIKLGVDERV